MDEVKLFVSCHRMAPVPRSALLCPVQVGAALSTDRFPGFLYDDTGENISSRNRSYCELTAQYWAWKNVEADHYGFFHYRRYLYPDPGARLPYRIEAAPTPELLARLGYDRFPELISQYDLILPKGEDMRIPVREHYANAPFHHKKDLDLVEALIGERSPEYVPAMEKYLSGTVCYFGNIFIAGKAAFQDYCGWLFPLLAEFDRRADLRGYGPQEQRADGYLAERLLGIWAMQHRDFRTLELPRVHFMENGAQRRKKQLINLFLPPGSKRRAAIKSYSKWIGRSNHA